MSYDDPSVILSGGPVRVQVDAEDPDFEPTPVGFVQPPRFGPLDPSRMSSFLIAETKPAAPQLWQDEGDQA